MNRYARGTGTTPPYQGITIQQIRRGSLPVIARLIETTSTAAFPPRLKRYRLLSMLHVSEDSDPRQLWTRVKFGLFTFGNYQVRGFRDIG